MLKRYPNLIYAVVVVVVVLIDDAEEMVPTVIIMVQIVNIFCSPPHLLFYIIFVPIKNYTNFYFFLGFFCVRRVH